MCPLGGQKQNKWGVKIKSNSQHLVWPPAALSTAVHLLLMHSTTLLPRHLQFQNISRGNGPSPRSSIQQVPDVLNVIEIWALRSSQNTDIPAFQEIMHRTSCMAVGIVMLEGHVRMSL